MLAADFGHPEPLRVSNLLEQNLGPLLLLFEVGYSLANVVFDNIVAQDHANGLAVCEMFGQRQSVGDAAFPFLVGVVQMLQSKIPAIP